MPSVTIRSFLTSRLHLILAGVAALAIASALLPWYSSRLQHSALQQAGNGFQVEGLRLAERAAVIDPVSISALFVLAGAQNRVGHQADARQTLLKATELEPQNFATWQQLAQYERHHWGMPAEAEQHYARAIELNPLDESLKREAAGR